ncbi:MAG: translation initiation factor [Mariprofundales bacterium]|nr:translation initiation factor [Mariprofundales bacterium]
MRERSLVYSTETGRTQSQRRHPPAPATQVNGGTTLVRREKKGRGGKEVTVILGLSSNQHDLKAIAKRLKTILGTGGAVKNGTIEIQGNHCDKVLTLLAEQGITAKRGGG